MGQGGWRRQCLSLEGQGHGGLAVPGTASLLLRAAGEVVHPSEEGGMRRTGMLDPVMAAQLTNDDDPALWDVAANTILADAALTGREAKDDVFVQIGSCRHWIRPHQSRWIADRGIAAPFGYHQPNTCYSYPDFQHVYQSVFFKMTRSGWEPGRTGA